MDNATRRELLYKARAAGYPGSILDVYANYAQGRDLIAEFQQQQQMQQAQQMSNIAAQQSGMQMPQQQMQQPQQQMQPQMPVVPSSPTPAPNFTPPQPPAPIGVQSQDTPVGIVSGQSGPNQGRAIFATGGFTEGDPIKGSTPAPTFGGSKPQFLSQPGPRKENLNNQTAKENIPAGYKIYHKEQKQESKLFSHPNTLLDHAIEFVDPTGIMSYDDASKAYNNWKNSGNTFPTLDQGLSMFSAVPVLGKLGKFTYADPMIDAMKPIMKTFPWQQALNVWETQSESQENYSKKTGGFKYDEGGPVDWESVKNPELGARAKAAGWDTVEQYRDAKWGYNKTAPGTPKGDIPKFPTRTGPTVEAAELDKLQKEQLQKYKQYKKFKPGDDPAGLPSVPIVEAALMAPVALNSMSGVLGAELAGSGVTVGNIVNPAFATQGVVNFANPKSDFRQALTKYNKGRGDWKDVAFEGGLNALNFLGAKSLPGDVKAIGNAVRGDINSFRAGFGNELKGALTTSKANRQAAIDEANEFSTNWANHPETKAKYEEAFRQRVKEIPSEVANEFPYYSAAEQQLAVNDRLKQLSLGLVQASKFEGRAAEYSLKNQLSDFLGGRQNIHQGNVGVSYFHGTGPTARKGIEEGLIIPDKKLTQNWVSRSPKLSSYDRASTAIHENTHDWINSETLAESGQSDLIRSFRDPEVDKLFVKWEALREQGKKSNEIAKIMGEENAYKAYLADPTEVHARIMELRNHFEATPATKMSTDQAARMMKMVEEGKTPVDPDFLQNFKTPENFADAFNKLFTPTAIVGGVGTGYLYNKNKEQKKLGGTKCYTCVGRKRRV
jgi:hypothetical protein